MKKSFTMIELIFVIVILGILASVAIPKLAATRDDAKTATLTSQIKEGTAELIAYYTSQGGDVNFSKISSSSQIVFNELIKRGWAEVKDDNTSYVYDNKDTKRVCLIYKTNGKEVEVDYNDSNTHTLCSDIKRIIKERNYSILNSVVNF
jgi:prepilin-type N-terminal cleavage/methylation domain-containing protein